MPVAAQNPFNAIACPACGASLPVDAFSGENETACPYCQVKLSGTLYPAFWQPVSKGTGLADHAGEGDAVCFFHPENRAALSCDRCGRFLCQVCDMPLGTRHLCPTCLSSGLGGDKLQELIVGRFLWSNLTLLFGLIPLIFFFFYFLYIISGSAAVFCAIFGWKRPGSLPRGRRHWITIVGLILGLIQLTIWGGFVLWFSNAIASNSFR